MWPLDPIADAAFEALQQREAELREEHAVYGLDAQEEITFHPLIAEGMRRAGFGVLRERPFPHEWFRKLRPAKSEAGLALPLPRDRMRCDLALTPEPGQTLDDALVTEKHRRAEAKELEGTLFESLSTSHLAPGAPSAPDIPVSRSAQPNHGQGALAMIPPEEAFWLEIKVVGQFCSSAGIPGPNRTYTSELTRNPIADLRKLAEDHRIHHAGVLLIVFSADESVARHDLAVLAHRCLDKDLPVSAPIARSFRIQDRIGNTLCTPCLIGMRKS